MIVYIVELSIMSYVYDWLILSYFVYHHWSLLFVSNSLWKEKTLYITTHVLQNLFHFGRVSNKKVQWRLIIQQHCVSNFLMSW